MLQVFHLNVAKVDRVLHNAPEKWRGHERSPRTVWWCGPVGARKILVWVGACWRERGRGVQAHARETECRHGHPSRLPGASTTVFLLT